MFTHQLYSIANIFLMLCMLGGQGTAVLKTTAEGTCQAYMPLISKSWTGSIQGHVTLSGAPVGDVGLELRYYDGVNWSTRASTSTQGDGSFSFKGVPVLGAGQRYYVRYRNSSDPSRLAEWGTRMLTGYSGEEMISIGDFDIANVALIYPFDSDVVSIPFNFSWTPRLASPTDSYEFNLFNPEGATPYFHSAALGYTGVFRLPDYPPDFSDGVWYGWNIWVVGSDGSYGISFYYNRVQFMGILAGPTGTGPMGPPAFPPAFHPGRGEGTGQ